MSEALKKTLLIVDDDDDIRQLLADALSQKGYQVLEAANGSRMWQCWQQGDIDLVIMDLYLRDEDGLQLAREIRDQSAIPIMMLTGKGDETDRILGLELAADDYMMKPFNSTRITGSYSRIITPCQCSSATTATDPRT